jgi:hypothetical protein
VAGSTKSESFKYCSIREDEQRGGLRFGPASGGGACRKLGAALFSRNRRPAAGAIHLIG